MTARNDLDRQLNDFLRDGPDELPYESFDAVRDRTEMTRQRVVIGPWRLPEMNKILTFGLAAAAVVVIGLFVGAQLLGAPSGGIGSDPPESSEPIATPEPTAIPEPSTSPTTSPPPLTQSFTSTLHGISLSYPEGWIAQAATEPWTAPTFPLDILEPYIDVLHDPILTGNLFLAIASQPIGEAAPADWIAEQMASEEGCASTEPVAVDSATGVIGSEGCHIAVVTAEGRGYWIQLYTSDDDPDAVAAYDRAWFAGVLATVQLHPEDAVDSGA